MKLNDQSHACATVQRFSEGCSAPRWAEMYDAPTEVLADANFRARRDFTVDYVASVLPAGGRVLDLGCGTGPVLAELRRRGIACTGLDLAPDMLERARARLRAQGLGADDLHAGDCCQTPFADASFDVVVCLGVISYVEAYDTVLREIVRLLKPGGLAIVSFRNRFNPVLWDPWLAAETLVRAVVRRPRREPYAVGRFMDFREVRAAMDARGLRYVRDVGIGFGPLRLRRKPLLTERASIRLSDASTAVLRRIGWQAPFRWLADVSLWVYRKPG